jgi:phosphoglucosamine mutase
VVVIGKDTRVSGYMLESALEAGVTSMGGIVYMLGVLPTPGVAYITESMRADAGFVVSASHNPYQDNGIKVFAGTGFKLPDAEEDEIERLMLSGTLPELTPHPDHMGRAYRLDDAIGRYVVFLKSSFQRRLTLTGLKVAMDVGNGATYKVAPMVFRELGAEVQVIHNQPDGFNINKGCGSTVPEYLCAQVQEHGADLGIALDGDADRVVLADEHGELIDGDQILALIAHSWHAAGSLTGGGIVATVMSNLGLERFLLSRRLALHRTKVGDRYVAERMRELGANVGGEQSGHVILTDFATTGDGLLAALQVLAVIVQQGKPASETCRMFQPLPQRLQNVRFSGASPLRHARVQAAIADAEESLNGSGRLLIRESGTEPLVRVMAEGEDEATVGRIVDALCVTIAEVARLGESAA